MKKVIRLTESDMKILVSKILNEDKKSKSEYEMFETKIEGCLKGIDHDDEENVYNELMNLKKQISKNHNLSNGEKKELVSFINLGWLDYLIKSEND